MSGESIHILAHRGFWKTEPEENTETAFRRALEHGCGIETDFRDLDGEIVIAHDMARKGAMPARRFFEIYKEYKGDLPLAVNIKAEALQVSLKTLFKEFGINNYFCFDMSLPDTLSYVRHNFIFYSRLSDLEPMPLLLAKAAGLWVDQIEADWLKPETLVPYVAQGKTLVIVSPELHRRPHEATWKLCRSFAKDHPEARILLCTDLVDDALKFFA